MVAMDNKLLLSLSLAVLISLTTASLIENLIRDTDPCEEVCQKTYAQHTYDRSLSGACCYRGCRLYSILELIREGSESSSIIKLCHENCKEAYPSQTEETLACMLGCNSQKPYTDKLNHLFMGTDLMDGGMPGLMNPIQYMHSLYNNLASQVSQHMSVTWSFFMQDGTGRMIIVKSQPQIIDFSGQDVDVSGGTSSFLETNIEPAGNTATQVLDNLQLKSAKIPRDVVSAAEANPWNHQPDDGLNSDWLACITNKTGMPRLFLSLVILVSAIALVWLCLSAAVGSPERKHPQKLSVSANLDYLLSLHDQKGIKGVLPQDFAEVQPLPTKILVEKI